MKYRDLKEYSDRELAELHDAVDKHTQYGTSYYLEELRHREVMRALNSIAGVVEHVAHISFCADIVANYFLAKWKVESHGLGVIKEPPEAYKHDPRIKV